LWLACYTQEEIAEREGMIQPTIARKMKDFMQIGHLSEMHKIAANHLTDFDFVQIGKLAEMNKIADFDFSQNGSFAEMAKIGAVKNLLPSLFMPMVRRMMTSLHR